METADEIKRKRENKELKNVSCCICFFLIFARLMLAMCSCGVLKDKK